MPGCKPDQALCDGEIHRHIPFLVHIRNFYSLTLCLQLHTTSPLISRTGNKKGPLGALPSSIDILQVMDLPSDQAPVHPIGTHDIGDNASANDTFDLKQEAIPKIEVRSSTFHETSTAVADAHSNISPAPSSPGLTACETSSNISVEDGKELEHLSDQQRQQMIAEVFTQLDQLVGLTQVKDQFLEIKRTIETYQKQNVNLKHERSHIKFLGNPGTGEYGCELHIAPIINSF